MDRRAPLPMDGHVFSFGRARLSRFAVLNAELAKNKVTERTTETNNLVPIQIVTYFISQRNFTITLKLQTRIPTDFRFYDNELIFKKAANIYGDHGFQDNAFAR